MDYHRSAHELLWYGRRASFLLEGVPRQVGIDQGTGEIMPEEDNGQQPEQSATMHIGAVYKQRIRIETDRDYTDGRHTHIYNLDTGEVITNILEITIHMSGSPREAHTAKITYALMNEQNRPVIISDELVTGTLTVDNPELAITVFEVGHE